MNLQKQPCWRSEEYTRAAKGQSCTMNSPWCTYKDEETCFRHLNESFAGKGKGLKAHDFAGFDGCQGCEDWYNSYVTSNLPEFGKEEKNWYVLRAVIRTLYRRFEQGVLKV